MAVPTRLLLHSNAVCVCVCVCRLGCIWTPPRPPTSWSSSRHPCDGLFHVCVCVFQPQSSLFVRNLPSLFGQFFTRVFVSPSPLRNNTGCVAHYTSLNTMLALGNLRRPQQGGREGRRRRCCGASPPSPPRHAPRPPHARPTARSSKTGVCVQEGKGGTGREGGPAAMLPSSTHARGVMWGTSITTSQRGARGPHVTRHTGLCEPSFLRFPWGERRGGGKTSHPQQLLVPLHGEGVRLPVARVCVIVCHHNCLRAAAAQAGGEEEGKLLHSADVTGLVSVAPLSWRARMSACPPLLPLLLLPLARPHTLTCRAVPLSLSPSFPLPDMRTRRSKISCRSWRSIGATASGRASTLRRRLQGTGWRSCACTRWGPRGTVGGRGCITSTAGCAPCLLLCVCVRVRGNLEYLITALCGGAFVAACSISVVLARCLCV